MGINSICLLWLGRGAINKLMLESEIVQRVRELAATLDKLDFDP